MKKLIFSLCGALVLAGTLHAGVQLYPVTPVTITSWQVSGPDLSALQGDNSLSLPPGAGLTRGFHDGTVVLHSVTSPIFGVAPADWPVLTVGPAALALTRQGNTGQLILVVNDTASALPLTVALDSTGRSQQPLELFLGFDPLTGTGVVAFADQLKTFQATADGSVVWVSVSSGGKSSWPQDLLEVLVIDSADETGLNDVASSSPNGANGSDQFKAALGKLRSAATVVGEPGGTGSAAPSTASANNDRPKRGGVGLEVYTPPSVRHRAANVRRVVTESLKS